MGIERIVNFVITRREGVRGQASQAYPVILTADSPNASYGSDMVKRYSVASLTNVATDWGTGSAAYKAFNAAKKQSPKVKYIYTAKRAAEVAAQSTLTITGTWLTGQTVAVSINGTVVSVLFSSTSSASMDALATAIDAVEGVASATHSTGTITIVATAGWVLSVGEATVTGSGTKPTFATAVTVAGHTIQDDIAALFAENKTPYLVYVTTASKGVILAAADYIEGLKKIGFYQTADSDTITSDTNDVGSLLKAADYTRSAVFYTTDTTKHWPMALAALCLSYKPGSVMFNGKVLAGITPDDLTDAAIGHLEDKNINNYAVLADEGMVLPGVMADGNQIHATRDQDYFETTFNAALANVFKVNPKVTINRRGGALFEGAGQSVLDTMVAEHVADGDYPAEFTAPDPATISEGDLAAHNFSGFETRFKIENAAVQISGTVDIQL